MKRFIKTNILISTLLFILGGNFYPLSAQELKPIVGDKVEATENQFSDAEIDQLLAPIALYPDSLLSQILVATTYPIEIIKANRWLIKNPDLDGEQLQKSVEDKDWDPSIKALIPFPKILAKLSEELEWTQDLGDAFLQDEKRLLKRVQILREQALASGNLKSSEQVKVIHKKETIYIEPAEPEVVYVPYYDTRVVYGSWRWSNYPPYYWDFPYYDRYSYYRPYPYLYWSPGIHIGLGFGFGFNWRQHYIVYVNHPHRYRYRNSRAIVRSRHSQRWHHNPHHRRGAIYRSRVVANRYHSNRRVKERTINRRIDQRHNPVSTRNESQNHHGNRTGNHTREINNPTVGRNLSHNRQQRIRSELNSLSERRRSAVEQPSHQRRFSSDRIYQNNRNENRSSNRTQTRTPVTRNHSRSRFKEPVERIQPVIKVPVPKVEVQGYPEQRNDNPGQSSHQSNNHSEYRQYRNHSPDTGGRKEGRAKRNRSGNRRK